jgi:hypothetical protein
LEESIFIETTGLGHSLHDDGLYKISRFYLKLNKPIHSTTNLALTQINKVAYKRLNNLVLLLQYGRKPQTP